MFFGAVAVVFLMVSSVAAVPQVQSSFVTKKIDGLEETKKTAGLSEGMQGRVNKIKELEVFQNQKFKTLFEGFSRKIDMAALVFPFSSSGNSSLLELLGDIISTLGTIIFFIACAIAFVVFYAGWIIYPWNIVTGTLLMELSSTINLIGGIIMFFSWAVAGFLLWLSGDVSFDGDDVGLLSLC